MVLKTIHAKGPKGSENIELLVQKARSQAGVERILVVYDEQSAHIYIDGDPPRPQKPVVRAS